MHSRSSQVLAADDEDGAILGLKRRIACRPYELGDVAVTGAHHHELNRIRVVD
jgi:hypothetical protein